MYARNIMLLWTAVCQEPNIYSLLGFVATSWYWNNTWFIFFFYLSTLNYFCTRVCVWVPASVWWTLYTQLCLPIKSIVPMMLLKYGEFLFLQFSFVIHFFNHCTNILDIKKNLERIMEHFARCISHISWTSFQIFLIHLHFVLSLSLSFSALCTQNYTYAPWKNPECMRFDFLKGCWMVRGCNLKEYKF